MYCIKSILNVLNVCRSCVKEPCNRGHIDSKRMYQNESESELEKHVYIIIYISCFIKRIYEYEYKCFTVVCHWN